MTTCWNFLICLCIGCNGTAGGGQGAAHTEGSGCDALSPIVSFRTDPDPSLWQDDANVSAVLFSRVPKGAATDRNAGELILVMLKDDQRHPTYTVVHVRAKSRIGDVHTTTETEITENTIDDAAARSVGDAWKRMTLGARWPDRDESLDQIARVTGLLWQGGRYTFDFSADSTRGQGESISPKPGTCTGELVGLGTLLMRFADEGDNEKRSAIRALLIAQGDALARRVER
jgi:hypothetical protein